MTHETPLCVCTGIRKCAICAPALINYQKSLEQSELESKQTYLYCLHCNRASPITRHHKQFIDQFLNQESHELKCQCTDNPENITLNGIAIFNQFICESEEIFLINEIEKSKWVESQSGRFKQDFGPKANFNKKKLKCSTFTGLPAYSQFITKRINTPCPDFVPVELCNLRYEVNRAACIDPHYDDFWLWGDRLITINMLANTILTLTPGVEVMNQNCQVFLPMAKQSLLILSNDARYKWLHSIKKSHVKSKRLAITIRELSDEFKGLSPNGELGRSIEKLALSYKGISVGMIEDLAISNCLKGRKIDPLLPPNDIFNDNILELNTAQFKVVFNTENQILYDVCSQNSQLSLNVVKVDWDLYSAQMKLQEKVKALDMVDFISFKVDQSNGYNMCLYESVTDEKGSFNDCDSNVYKIIGNQIARWSSFATDLIQVESMGNDLSLENILLISNDFKTYKNRFVKELQCSQIDLSLKSKFTAVLFNAKEVIEELNLIDHVGVILNDFEPSRIIPMACGRIRVKTCFQNVRRSFLLVDLAKCLIELMVVENINPEMCRLILKGYTEVLMKSLNMKLLYYLVLMNLAIRVMSFNVSHKFVKLFNETYLDENNFYRIFSA